MRILFFLFIWLTFYYKKNLLYFFQKLLGVIISFIFILEYIYIFFFQNLYIYSLIVYRYVFKENVIIFKKNINRKSYRNKKEFLIKKKKKNKIISFFLNLYYRRRIYFGLTVVYIQIFLRKIKEFKNYIIFFFNFKLKKSYNSLKKYILSYSLRFYLFSNYNLVMYITNFKKKIFNFIVLISFIEIYKKTQLKKNIYIFFLKIFSTLIEKIKKWKPN